MPRSVRVEFPGAFYHVMVQGNRHENIFLDDDDRRYFLHALSQACEGTGWLIHAWVLMGNHYHLLLQTPDANLVSGMLWLQNTYTRRFNVRHRAWGRVFGDRYKAIYVDGDQPFYYQTLLDYIHLNPVRAGIIKPARKQSVLDYPWSSLAGGYALTPGKRANWLAVPHGLGSFGISDSVSGRRSFVTRLDRRAVAEETKSCRVPPLEAEVDARTSHLRRGWYWGGETFRKKLTQLAEKITSRNKGNAYRTGAVKRAHDVAEPERLIAEGLHRAGVTERELRGQKGSSPIKVALAAAIWKTTTVDPCWIANRLWMKSASNVSKILNRATKAP
jgi:putative transposase